MLRMLQRIGTFEPLGPPPSDRTRKKAHVRWIRDMHKSLSSPMWVDPPPHLIARKKRKVRSLTPRARTKHLAPERDLCCTAGGAQRQTCILEVASTACSTVTALHGGLAAPRLRSVAGLQHVGGARACITETAPAMAEAFAACSSGGQPLQLRRSTFAAPAIHLCRSGGTPLQHHRSTFAAPAAHRRGLLLWRKHLRFNSRTLQLRWRGLHVGRQALAAPTARYCSFDSRPLQLRQWGLAALAPAIYRGMAARRL